MAWQVNGGAIFATMEDAMVEANDYWVNGGTIVAVEEVSPR